MACSTTLRAVTATSRSLILAFCVIVSASRQYNITVLRQCVCSHENAVVMRRPAPRSVSSAPADFAARSPHFALAFVDALVCNLAQRRNQMPYLVRYRGLSVTCGDVHD